MSEWEVGKDGGRERGGHYGTGAASLVEDLCSFPGKNLWKNLCLYSISGLEVRPFDTYTLL